MLMARGSITIGASLLVASAAMGVLQPGNVVLVYNSRNAESLAIRDAYIAARPGVWQFDLNDPAIVPGSISRADFVTRLRNPIRAWIAGVGFGHPDLSQQIMAIATTRGLPARVLSGNDEFQLHSGWASVESELSLLQQDLEAVGSDYLPVRYKGAVFNPYWRALGLPIDSYSRASVLTPRTFVNVVIPPGPAEVWQVTGLTPGDLYLVCRLDSAATAGGASAVQNAQSLIARSQNLIVDRCGVRALFDEFGSPPPPTGFDFDDGEVPPLFPDRADFENAAAFMSGFGFAALHDHTFNFVTGSEFGDPSHSLVALGTYGENHSFANWGEDPAGDGVYISGYPLHPAAVFIAFESWSGTSLYTGGAGRGGQQQCLDFIAAGGSFTIGSVMEPFAFTIPDLQDLLPAMYAAGLTFAEAAYTSMPVLSWQFTPVGDPLARVALVGPGPTPGYQPVGCFGDADRDGDIDFADVTAVLTRFAFTCATGSSRGDADGSGFVSFADVTEVLSRFGSLCD